MVKTQTVNNSETNYKIPYIIQVLNTNNCDMISVTRVCKKYYKTLLKNQLESVKIIHN